MKVLPTLEGGLKLMIDNDLDWQVLAMVSQDAGSGVSDELADLMDEDAMWEDVVKPDLDALFEDQLTKLNQTIASAQQTGEDEVCIEPQDADTWYGALNQARLQLEKAYQLSKLREEGDLQALESEPRSAFFRDRFYCHLQSLLLDYVME